MQTNNNIRLRGKKHRTKDTWELGSIPEDIVVAIGKQLIYRAAIGDTDITGNTFSTAFANAIGGVDLTSPLGVVDVVRKKNVWSAKTIKASDPFTLGTARLISGRNSVDYSLGISDPHADVRRTGKAVLSIWNERINEAVTQYGNALRLIVLVRNCEKNKFVLFEGVNTKFAPNDYQWKENTRGNFEGREKVTGIHKFTWQPHGAQFTILRQVPGSAIKFSIREQEQIGQDRILSLIEYDDDWITINS